MKLNPPSIDLQTWSIAYSSFEFWIWSIVDASKKNKKNSRSPIRWNLEHEHLFRRIRFQNRNPGNERRFRSPSIMWLNDSKWWVCPWSYWMNIWSSLLCQEISHTILYPENMLQWPITLMYLHYALPVTTSIDSSLWHHYVRSTKFATLRLLLSWLRSLEVCHSIPMLTVLRLSTSFANWVQLSSCSGANTYRKCSHRSTQVNNLRRSPWTYPLVVYHSSKKELSFSYS